MLLADSTRLGPYEVLAPLGTGSMGEVYRARDTRLNRDVALKIISGDAIGDVKRRRRFEQEARSASALNHPNIVTIYDLGIESGTSYIASELVEGESLRDVIRRGPIDMHHLADLAIQMADGLAAAHEAGVVHRDFKPENIMINREGRVKILDFGLAKLSRAALARGINDTSDVLMTEPGLILGTVGYMSPEQANGQEAGIQADQFSLGVVLHEMASGQPAFRRATPLETLVAIAHVDKKPFTPGPSAFRLLVDRLLSKDPPERFASTREVVTRLRKIKGELPEELERRTAAASQPGRRAQNWRALLRRLLLLVRPNAIPALLCALAVTLWLLQSSRSLAVAPPLSFLPLADERELQVWPAWSPDGDAVAFAAAVDSSLQLFEQRLDGGAALPIARCTPDCLYPFWSRSGSSLYYIQQTGGDSGLWRSGTWGGSAELIQKNVAQADLSPNGRRMVFLRNEPNEPGRVSLWASDPPQAAPARYREAGWESRSFLTPSFVRISPAGDTAALWAINAAGASELWTIPLGGGAPAQHRFTNAGKPRWFTYEDDSTLLLPHSDGSLLRFDLRRNSGTPLSLGPGSVGAAEVAPKGQALAFTTASESYRLLSIRLDGTAAPTRLMGHSPAWSPARAELAYVAEHQGKPGIWVLDADGEPRLVVGPAQFADGRVLPLDSLSYSPHGHRLLFRRASSLWSASSRADASMASQIGTTGTDPIPGGSSPDGNWLVYSALTQGQRVVLKQRVDGEGGSIPIGTGFGPRWSPQGNEVAYRDPAGRLVRVATDGSHPTTVTSEPVLAFAWDPRSQQLWSLRTREHNLILEDHAGRTINLGPAPASLAYAAASGREPIDGMSISADGQTLTYALFDARASLWLANGWPSPAGGR